MMIRQQLHVRGIKPLDDPIRGLCLTRHPGASQHQEKCYHWHYRKKAKRSHRPAAQTAAEVAYTNTLQFHILEI